MAQEMKDILEDYEEVFQPFEGIPPEDRIKHEINLTPGVKPSDEKAIPIIRTTGYGSRTTSQEGTRRRMDFNYPILRRALQSLLWAKRTGNGECTWTIEI